MNPINVTGYDRAERAAWAEEEVVKITFEQLVDALGRSGALMRDDHGVYKKGGVFPAMREDVDLTAELRLAVEILNREVGSSGDIEITIRRSGETVEVLQGNRTTGQLCMGEVIEQVVRVIYADTKPRGPYPMLTPEGWEDRWNKSTNAPEGTEK